MKCNTRLEWVNKAKESCVKTMLKFKLNFYKSQLRESRVILTRIAFLTPLEAGYSLTAAKLANGCIEVYIRVWVHK